MTETHTNSRLMPRLLLLIAGILAYTLPWIVNPGSGLTMGAYDLAEWASLHPVVRNEAPILLTTLLLRVPILCLGLLLLINTVGQRFRFNWWLAVIVFGLICAYSLPPLEFVTTARDDLNYRQQFVLTIVTGFLGLLVLTGLLDRWRRQISVLLSVVGIGTSLWGLERVYDLMFGFSMPLSVGMGVFLLVLIFVFFVGLDMWKMGWQKSHPR